MNSVFIVIENVAEQPDERKFWSYPLSEIPYIIEQIKDNDRENGYKFYLYHGRIYESIET